MKYSVTGKGERYIPNILRFTGGSEIQTKKEPDSLKRFSIKDGAGIVLNFATVTAAASFFKITNTSTIERFVDKMKEDISGKGYLQNRVYYLIKAN